ncbi:MAG: tryptophan--tRNA ligase [Oscillospiraceae bacterium]|nr:tryptophan--tRNA ligase [Oscillospiraceae bacterium]
MENKKTILSAIQPSGALTIGNYLGALKNWAALQDEYNCCFCVADMHAITVRQVPAELRKNSLDLLALFIAAGIDVEKHILFIQSQVPQHAQLSWVLTCNTYMGELSRMTQFKDKSQRYSGSVAGENINAGLFTYPSLMAADILLYQADLVPVGADQKQHLELARDLAVRFNNAYSETFKVPEPYIAKVAARIMSLQDPFSKMSKSDDNANSYILLLDPIDTAVKKVKRAVTDSGAEVKRGEGKEGVENLMNIYSAVTGKNMEEIELEFEGKGYGDFKGTVAESVADCLRPIQEKYNDLMKNKDYLQEVYTAGAQKAQGLANKTLRKVYKKVGFLQ